MPSVPAARSPGHVHPRPALTVACVVFGLDEARLQVLLIRRDREPFRGAWALPGGLVRLDEDLDQAARRELREETGLDRLFLEQLHTFGAIGRDPRERVVTVAYYALLKLSDHRVRAATDALDAAWFAVDDLPRLAFDHAEIVSLALGRLRGKLRDQPIGFELLPPKFTLAQLQRLYEIVLQRPLDKRNFRKKVLSLGLLEALEEVEQGVAHRAARLYRFDQRRLRKLVTSGISLAL